MPFDNTKPKAKNLARGVVKLPPAGIAYLNAQVEGFGDALSQALGHLNNRADAQAGHGGSVAIAKQIAQDTTGRSVDALKLHGDTIGGVDWANRNDQVVPLEQMRAFFTCDHFGGHPSGFPGWFEDCVGQTEQRAAEAPPPHISDGLIHAFWGITFHAPPDADTFNGDPSFSEAGHGGYWQMIIPQTVVIDRGSIWRPHGGPIVQEIISFGIYDLNQSATVFPLVCKTAPFSAGTLEQGLNVEPLTERVTIEPGLYAVAWVSPCFTLLSFRNNVLPFIMVNALWNSTWNGFNGNTPPPGNSLPRYGSFFSVGELPDQLDSSTVDLTGDWDATSFNGAPIIYFDDSRAFE